MKYEIKKIIGNRFVIIGIIAVFAYTFYYTYNLSYRESEGNAYFLEYGGTYSDEKWMLISDKMDSLLASLEKNPTDETVAEQHFKFGYIYAQASNYESCKEYRRTVLKNAKRNLASSDAYISRTNQKIYNQYAKDITFEIFDEVALRMLTIAFTVFHNVDYINIVLLIFIASGIFVMEHENRTFRLIYTSFHGRRRIYINKLLCISIFSTILACMTTIICMVTTLKFTDIKNLLQPVQAMEQFIHSPYDISIFGAICIMTLLRAAGYIIIGVLAAILSIPFRRNIMPVIMNILIIITGLAICNYFSDYKPFMNSVIRSKYNVYQQFRTYSFFPYISDASGYISRFDSVDVFGFPVMRLTVNIVFHFVVIALIAVLGFHLYVNSFRKSGG